MVVMRLDVDGIAGPAGLPTRRLGDRERGRRFAGTPAPPHLAVGAFHRGGESHLVAQRRGGNAFAHPPAQFNQPPGVAGERHRLRQVRLLIPGHPLRQPEVAHDARADAPQRRARRQRQQRHTHPDAVIDHRPATVREAVEHDVDLVQRRPQVLAVAQRHPRDVHAVFGQKACKVFTRRRDAERSEVQDQARLRQGREDPGP